LEVERRSTTANEVRGKKKKRLQFRESGVKYRGEWDCLKGTRKKGRENPRFQAERKRSRQGLGSAPTGGPA